MPPAVLGEFEHQVLLAILRRGAESYSVEIVVELETSTGRDVSTAAVFVALKRLEAKGLLADRLVQPRKAGDGHARRYFRLTRQAMQVLRASRRSYLRLWDGLESKLDVRES
jgi:DNA-binding PadR family transcriptional regulator